MKPISIALNRFGLGARPGEPVPADPRRWLLDQFDRYDPRPAAIAAVPGSETLSAGIARYEVDTKAYRQAAADETAPLPGDKPGMVEFEGKSVTPERAIRLKALAEQRDAHIEQVGARAHVALTSSAPFVERLVHFWANHFTVSGKSLNTNGLAGTIEMEAVRPHVLGRFSDMLLAAERHPAMLFYLDQASSFGPDSEIGQRVASGRRNRKLGLNENLAREILELHTLGVRGGYDQDDVTELARALTGSTVTVIGSARAGGMTRDQPPGRFVFLPKLHEPGARTVMGKTYPAAGVKQSEAILRDLAVHPATAAHLATKLARHFAGDEPPPALVQKLERAYLASGGDLPTVYRALVASPEAWVERPVKFKTPWEWMLSSYRAVGMEEVEAKAVVGLANQLGQPVWRAGQPAGYDDIAAGWAGPDAVMRRVEAAERLAGRTRDIDARSLSEQLFPGSLSSATTEAIQRAESPGQALALLLVSPEAMRR